MATKRRRRMKPVLDPLAVTENGKKAKRQPAGHTYGDLVSRKRLSDAVKKNWDHNSAGRFSNDQAVAVLRDTSVAVRSPEDITTEHLEEVWELVSDGETVPGACRMLNISVRSFLSKVSKSAKLTEIMRSAREDGADARIAEADRVLRRVLKERRSSAFITAASNYAHHCRWVAMRLRPKAWGDQIEVNQNTVLTDERRDTVRDKILAESGSVPKIKNPQDAQ